MENFVLRKEFFIDSAQGDINRAYNLGKKLGDGSYGYVYIATHTQTNVKRAIKQIPKYKVKNPARLQAEINIMKTADHPHIVKLYEVWEDARNLYLVLELCDGGELFDYIVKKKRLTEREAAVLFQQILLSLRYLHNHQIAHRDLKPENLLLSNKSSEVVLKLCDFGLAKNFSEEEEKMTTKAGTPFYISPEILAGEGYGFSCDVWSAGVILYILLCGYPPFYGQSDAAILEKVRAGNYSFERPEWRTVTETAKDLIRQLLVVNPENRYSIDQALEHPWITQHNVLPDEPLSLDIDSLREFRNGLRLQKAVLMCIASQVSDNEISHLREAFIKLDTNGDGCLTLAELSSGLAHIPGPGINASEVEELMKSMDVDQNGTIDYTEFLAATLDRSIYLQQERLSSAFRTFDKDGSGKISASELREVLGSTLNQASSSLWGDLISEADSNGDGEIDYNEFIVLMGLRGEHLLRGR